jgi:4-amino-4-deoxy-L-arabinose transferase-like glycosyltransferase
MSLQGLFKAATEKSAGFQSKKMLFIWAAFIFFFFSISGSKLPSYILPIFPALAILIACELEMVSTPALRFSGALLALVGIAAATLSLTIGTLAKTAFELPLYNAGTPWIIVTAVFALIGAAVVFIYLKKNRDTAILALALSGFLCGQSAFLATDSWGKFSAGIEHVAAINAVLKPETKIYSVGQYEQSLPFYLGRTVTLVEHADEMEFGLEQQPELWISKRADFEKIWRQNADEARMAVAIMRPGVYQDMLKIGLPMRVIGEDPKRVIVTPF